MKSTPGHLLQEGFRQAKSITRKHSKSFYFASLMLGARQRQAAYCVYAICRLSDDAVDQSSLASKDKNIAEMENKIALAYSEAEIPDPLLLSFRATVRDYQIPKKHFDDLIQGMRMDLHKNRYADFDDLSVYCYRVAGVIGLIMLRIFGSTRPEAEKHAVELGIALQLTNILRDIKEDWGMGRVYIPQDELARHHIEEDAFKKCQLDSNLISLLKFQIARARGYYEQASLGIPYLPSPSTRLVVILIKNLYGEILSRIEKNGYDVFEKHARVPFPEKLLLALKALWRREFLVSPPAYQPLA